MIDDHDPSASAAFPMFSFLRTARGRISGVTAPAFLSSGLLAGAYAAAAGTDGGPIAGDDRSRSRRIPACTAAPFCAALPPWAALRGALPGGSPSAAPPRRPPLAPARARAARIFKHTSYSKSTSQ